MTTTVTVNVSPFNCRWIVPGSVASVGQWTFAVCCRVRRENRLVSEPECERCRLWEDADDISSVAVAQKFPDY